MFETMNHRGSGVSWVRGLCGAVLVVVSWQLGACGGSDGPTGAPSTSLDANIAGNDLRITCEETFPSSSPAEIAHILVLRSKFENGMTSTVRGVFTYKVNDDGLLTNLRGYWNMDAMQFGQVGEGN